MLIYQRVLGLGFMALAVLVFIAARQFPPGAMGDPGPQLLPMLVAVLMFPLGLALTLQRKVLDSEEKEGGEPVNAHRVLLAAALLVLTLVLVLALEWLGTALAMVLYLWIAAAMIGRRDPVSLLRYLVVSALIGGALYFIFVQVLGLTLPVGLLFEE